MLRRRCAPYSLPCVLFETLVKQRPCEARFTQDIILEVIKHHRGVLLVQAQRRCLGRSAITHSRPSNLRIDPGWNKQCSCSRDACSSDESSAARPQHIVGNDRVDKSIVGTRIPCRLSYVSVIRANMFQSRATRYRCSWKYIGVARLDLP